jgi:subtilisin family serine protease
MSRNKTILAIAFVLVVVLGLAFIFQVRQLQRQLRSSVSILPADSKSRQGLSEGGLDQDAALAGRPEVLVKFRAGVSGEAISELAGRMGDRVRDEIEAVPGLTVIDDPDNAAAPTVAARYRTLPQVEYAEPNYEITLDQPGSEEVRLNDPRVNEEWWLDDIGATRAWAITRGSGEIVVAVLDSGVEYTHVDLVNNMWTRPPSIAPYQDRDLGTIDDVHGYNAVSNDGDPMDDNGHGTNCAGIIGAECGNNVGVCGVNWKIAIMPLRFMNAGGFGTVADAVEAINYAIDRKRAGVNLRIINASWGLAQQSRALEDVTRKADEAGILFVAAGGSASNNNDATPHFPASYNAENIISVAAMDKAEALAQFSNYGAKSVQLAAPGRDILTTALGNDYEQRSGTSLAAPVVTGVAALALSVRPGLSVAQLRSLLLNSVDKLPGLRGKVSSGGRINAAKAVVR